MHPEGGGIFLGSAQRLGGKYGKSISKENLSAAMAEAATKRQRIHDLSTGSGRKLGGCGPGDLQGPLDQQELRWRAAQAAERRLRDDLWCPAGRAHDQDDSSLDQKEELYHKRKISSSSSTIDIQESNHQANSSFPNFTKPNQEYSHQTNPTSSGYQSMRENDSWMCELCSTRNDVTDSVCNFCSALCPALNEWSCTVCTLINETSACSCNLCGSERKDGTTTDYVPVKSCANNNNSNSVSPVNIKNTKSPEVVDLCSPVNYMEGTEDASPIAESRMDVDNNSVWVCNLCTFVNETSNGIICGLCNYRML